MNRQNYVGRFAPSPTGPLHLGSLLTAVASFLDAKKLGGEWLVRIEDIDPPRIMPGATDEILRVLEHYGLWWDRHLVYQSTQYEHYREVITQLKNLGAIYPCSCSRKEISDIAHAGVEGPVYPGTCRHRQHGDVRAWRFQLPDQAFSFEDLIQGKQTYDLNQDLGDFIVQRADGLFAYQLAVVVDDAVAGVTHVIRGMDLVHSTPRQVKLQDALDYPHPVYGHLPVIVNENGQKLSKQNMAAPIQMTAAAENWHLTLDLLGQQPPEELARWPLQDIINWAIPRWDRSRIPASATIGLQHQTAQ